MAKAKPKTNGNGRRPRLSPTLTAAPTPTGLEGVAGLSLDYLAEELVLPLTVTFDDLCKCIGGRDQGMLYVKMYTYALPDHRWEHFIDEWEELIKPDRAVVNIEALLDKHKIKMPEVAAELARAVCDMSGKVSEIIRAAARPHLARVSIKHALKEVEGENERMRERQAYGELPVPRQSNIINVSATANAVAASATAHGLPSFEDFIGDAEDMIFSSVQLPPAPATIDIPAHPATEFAVDDVRDDYHSEQSEGTE